VICGLATDYCVKNTALDALRAGFQVRVQERAVRGVDVEPGDSHTALEELRRGSKHRLDALLEPQDRGQFVDRVFERR
jgi:nicotinamidase-related amidase